MVKRQGDENDEGQKSKDEKRKSTTTQHEQLNINK